MTDEPIQDDELAGTAAADERRSPTDADVGPPTADAGRRAGRPGSGQPRATQVTMVLWRGDADGGEFTDYVLPAVEGEVVLDVIHRVQATQAPDLACRWNCKAGKCGSCSAEINGKPALMCMTRMSELPEGQDVVVAPLKTFPVIRDLVTDVSYNYEVAKRIPPFNPRAKTDDEVEAGGYRMAQIDVERSQEFRKCIECYLCQDVCHVIRDHEENKTAFAGPRFFARSAELEMHPLDVTDRRAILQKEQGLGKCNITKCCTEVCPEHIKITDNAIIPLKERVVDAQYDPVAWLGRKIRRRTKGTVAEAAATSPATGPAAVQPAVAAHGIPGPGEFEPVRSGPGRRARGRPGHHRCAGDAGDARGHGQEATDATEATGTEDRRRHRRPGRSHPRVIDGRPATTRDGRACPAS